MANNQLRISAKTLGGLALPEYCPRCFWLQMHCQMPYQIFPGIFSSIDSYSKKITWSYFEKYGVVPPWFNKFGDFTEPVHVPGMNKFFLIDEETNIKLTGVPDEMFKKRDRSYFIADYKTARFTGNQDSLMPIYVVQLNGYAMIAEQCGLEPVSGLGLVYYEPANYIDPDNMSEVFLKNGFHLPFNAHLLNIKLDHKKVVTPLLRKARKLADMKTPPNGIEGCNECKLLTVLIEAAREK